MLFVIWKEAYRLFPGIKTAEELKNTAPIIYETIGAVFFSLFNKSETVQDYNEHKYRYNHGIDKFLKL